VHAVGYGEMRPRVANTTAAAKAQNRRVEIVSEGMGGDSSLDMELAVWTREMVMAPLRFRSEAVDDEADDDPADARNQDLPPDGQAVDVVDRVFALAPERVVQEPDQEAEAHRAEPAQQADQRGDQHHIDLLCLAQAVVEAPEVADGSSDHR